MTEYSPEVERLTALIDVLREYVAFEVGKATRKRPRKVKAYPRPMTAAQRIERRRKFEGAAAISRRVLGARSIYHKRPGG